MTTRNVKQIAGPKVAGTRQDETNRWKLGGIMNGGKFQTTRDKPRAIHARGLRATRRLEADGSVLLTLEGGSL